jgi:hypothetical protein
VNRRTIYIVAFFVVLFHVGGYYLLTHLGTPAAGVRRAPRGRPNFGAAQSSYVDSTTGEKVLQQEIRVSTHLADPAMVERILQERAAKNSASPSATSAGSIATPPPAEPPPTSTPTEP